MDVLDPVLTLYQALRDALQSLLVGADPVLFFGLMAVLPLFGAPIALFLVLCGRFSWDIALIGVVLAGLANLSLSYLIAHSVARPLLQRLLSRSRYRIPSVTADNQFQVLLITRLTPGIPYAIQNYVLGVTRMPFWLYLSFSLLVLIAWAVAFITLGQSFFNGQPWLAVAGLLLILGTGLLGQSLLKRQQRKAGRDEIVADETSSSGA